MRPRFPRQTNRFQLSDNPDLDYKNFMLLQKFVTDRGKIVPRRISGVSSKEQRKICESIKRARFMALLPSGGANK